MIIKRDGWVFRVFLTENRKHYARERASHCTCAWCRNFYETVDTVYPALRPFLEEFGVHIEAPEEMMAFSPILCSCYYAVCGEILEKGSGDLYIDGIAVSPQTREEAMVNTTMKEPVFFFQVGAMMLPWVLDEPMEDADSPAKGQNFIQRLLRRWITE